MLYILRNFLQNYACNIKTFIYSAVKEAHFICGKYAKIFIVGIESFLLSVL